MPFDPTPNIEIVDTTLGVLLRARMRVAGGWVQDRLVVDEAYCVIGGVREDAARGRRADAVAYLYRALPKQRWWRPRRSSFDRFNNLTHTENQLANYNDAAGRTQADILALYDRAIALCRADHTARRWRNSDAKT